MGTKTNMSALHVCPERLDIASISCSNPLREGQLTDLVFSSDPTTRDAFQGAAAILLRLSYADRCMTRVFGPVDVTRAENDVNRMCVY